MGAPGGYGITHGMYRVPDLLTEDEFVKYMKDTYNRDIEFTDDVKVNPARALGQSFNMSPAAEKDADPEQRSLTVVRDPVLRAYNEADFGDAYGDKAAEKKAEEDAAANEPEVESKTDGSKTAVKSTTTTKK